MDTNALNSEATQEAALHVLGYHGVEGGIQAGSFTNSLIETITRADPYNFVLLSSVYPELANAANLYKNVEGGVEQLQEISRGLLGVKRRNGVPYLRAKPENGAKLIALDPR